MSFILKIVEGPNRGAEIALVEGVSVTLGKADTCDIVLADATMPDAPMTIAASADGVTLDGAPLEPFNVKTSGATSFAFGPSDAPWSPLVWSEDSDGRQAAGDAKDADGGEKPEAAAEAKADGEAPAEAPAEAPSEERPAKRRGLGCLVAAIVAILVILILAWLFRGRLRSLGDGAIKKWRVRGGGNTAVVEADAQVSPTFTLEKIASRYGLELVGEGGSAKLVGNFKTRAERLAATAEAFSSQPGVELDFSDDESFRTAAEDALFTLTEGALKVSVATNRFLHIVGSSASPLALQRTMEQLNADLPRLRGFEVSGVRLASLANVLPPSAGPASSRPAIQAPRPPVTLPVCGILTSPYPCLIARDGRRYMEGAEIAGSVILKIEADSVTLTNAMGEVTWRP